jgi:hypothetical protein
VLDHWGLEAIRLGWTGLDLFGVHPDAPAARYDAMGLVPLLRGDAVVSMTSISAGIAPRSGGRLTYLRRPRVGSVLPWELPQAGRR